MSAETRRILHLGLGAFHRAHQAVYLHRLRATGDASWVLAAANIRADPTPAFEQLRAQGGVYTLETVDERGHREYERIAALQSILPWQPSLAGLVEVGADAATRIISFTVTEAGYGLDASGRLDRGAPEIVAELERVRSGRPGMTLYGALTAIVRERMRRGAGPVTLLSCDNLRTNGGRSRAALLDFLDALGDAAAADWVRGSTTSPNAMVDRITPRPTADVVERVRAATGIDDPAAVMSERYTQWVIEDDFAAGRPAWERVGVEPVTSVAPYEEAKIRLLNASHSAVAWAGALVGYRHIHECVNDPWIRAVAHDYATADAIPALGPSPIDLAAYRDRVLARFANAALRDSVQRVAADSYAKIAQFVAPTVRDRLAQGHAPDAVAMLPALFLAFLQRWQRGALPFAHVDAAMPLAAAAALWSRPLDAPAALASDPGLWGRSAVDARWIAAVRRASSRVNTWLGVAVRAR